LNPTNVITLRLNKAIICYDGRLYDDDDYTIDNYYLR